MTIFNLMTCRLETSSRQNRASKRGVVELRRARSGGFNEETGQAQGACLGPKDFIRPDMRTSQSGFILLMSSIVISVILVAVVFSVSFSGFFTRFNLLDSYNKEASLNLAQSCGDIAVLKRIQDDTYTGNEVLSIGSDECNIRPIPTTPPIIIETTATKGGAVSNIVIDLDSSTPPNITRYREVGSF